MNARKTTLTNLCRLLLATIPWILPLVLIATILCPVSLEQWMESWRPIQRHSNPPLGLDDDCNHQLEPTNHRGILECIPPIQSYCNSLLEMDNTHDHQLDPTSHPSVLECVSPIQSHCNSPLGLEYTHDHPLAPPSHPSVLEGISPIQYHCNPHLGLDNARNHQSDSRYALDCPSQIHRTHNHIPQQSCNVVTGRGNTSYRHLGTVKLRPSSSQAHL